MADLFLACWTDGVPDGAVRRTQLCPFPRDRGEAWPFVYLHVAQLICFWRPPTYPS